MNEEADCHDISDTVVQPKSVLQNVVPGMDLTEHYSEKSDISCTMNILIDTDCPISTENESPSKSPDSLDHESQTSNDIEEAAELHEDAIVVPEGKKQFLL